MGAPLELAAEDRQAHYEGRAHEILDAILPDDGAAVFRDYHGTIHETRLSPSEVRRIKASR